MHYVDEGSKNAQVTFVCLHGQPSWAYLYRKMIPIFVEAGHRVVAPDFFGFGRSDKPTALETYTFHFHRSAIMRLFERLKLKNVCLVVQDWGGLIGLTLPMEYPDQITRLIVMNTGLAVGMPAGKGFDDWKQWVLDNPDFSIAKLFKRSEPQLTEDELKAYEAPFPDATYRAGAITFPQLVMVTPEMEGVAESMKAAGFLSNEWSGDSFMAVGMKDPVLGPPVMKMPRKVLKGCPEPLEIAEGGHFVQEHGAEISKAALTHFGI